MEAHGVVLLNRSPRNTYRLSTIYCIIILYLCTRDYYLIMCILIIYCPIKSSHLCMNFQSQNFKPKSTACLLAPVWKKIAQVF